MNAKRVVNKAIAIAGAGLSSLAQATQVLAGEQQSPLAGAVESWVEDEALPIALGLAAVGTLAMIMIDLTKQLLPVRRWFQKYQVKRWIRRQIRTAGLDGSGGTELPGKVFLGTVELAMGGNADALFDLEMPQVTAQINAGVTQALAEPETFKDLIAVWARLDRDKIGDVEALIGAAQDLRNQRREALAAAKRPGTPQAGEKPEEPSKAEEARKNEEASRAIKISAAQQSLSDAQSRLTPRIQRSLDVLQITVAHRWQWTLHIAAVAISFAIIWGYVRTTGINQLGLPDMLLLALLGGFIAPFARDIVAGLQRLRRGG